MFLVREGLQSQISILKHCLMRVLIDINQLTLVFPFAEARSVDPNHTLLKLGPVYRNCAIVRATEHCVDTIM